MTDGDVSKGPKKHEELVCTSSNELSGLLFDSSMSLCKASQFLIKQMMCVTSFKNEINE